MWCISLLNKVFFGLQSAVLIIPFMLYKITLVWFLYVCIFSMIIVGGMEKFYSSQGQLSMGEAFAFQSNWAFYYFFFPRCPS